MEVRIHTPGLLTTVQDLGRPGHRAQGVPLAGAVDTFAHQVANLLVGNPRDAATLECTLLGPVLEFSADTWIAIGGATFSDVPSWEPLRVRAGERVAMGRATRGCRGYIAVAGGIDVPPVLGSRSTYLRAGFGGHGGRAVAAGDILTVGDTGERKVHAGWRIAPSLLPHYGEAGVRVVPGLHADQFVQYLDGQLYHVKSQSDRMGIRLEGPRLVRTSDLDVPSTTVTPGTVQVPPEGQPIVLMADAQTLGGYPQIAHVISVDLPLLAQLPPGAPVSFTGTTLAEAHARSLARHRALAMLQQGLSLKIR